MYLLCMLQCHFIHGKNKNTIYDSTDSNPAMPMCSYDSDYLFYFRYLLLFKWNHSKMKMTLICWFPIDSSVHEQHPLPKLLLTIQMFHDLNLIT